MVHFCDILRPEIETFWIIFKHRVEEKGTTKQTVAKCSHF